MATAREMNLQPGTEAYMIHVGNRSRTGGGIPLERIEEYSDTVVKITAVKIFERDEWDRVDGIILWTNADEVDKAMGWREGMRVGPVTQYYDQWTGEGERKVSGKLEELGIGIRKRVNPQTGKTEYSEIRFPPGKRR